jgi:hypothetical protein
MAIHHEATLCPRCGHKFDALDAADGGPGAPDPGDITVCIECLLPLEIVSMSPMDLRPIYDVSTLPAGAQEAVAFAQARIGDLFRARAQAIAGPMPLPRDGYRVFGEAAPSALEHVPTPVGAECWYCDRPIAEHDSGMIDLDGDVWHHACVMHQRVVFGERWRRAWKAAARRYRIERDIYRRQRDEIARLAGVRAASN